MSQHAKIGKYLGGNKYEIIFPEPKPYNGNPSDIEIAVAHDYVAITDSCGYQIDHKENPNYDKNPADGGPSNWIIGRATLQIKIRDMVKFIVPHLLKHEYFQKEHLKDRFYTEDDNSFKKEGLKKPRWKKGDSYPSYAYGGCIIKYREGKWGQRVAFRCRGQAHYNDVDIETFNKIKDSLNLNSSKY